jgi:hypothetical protein
VKERDGTTLETFIVDGAPLPEHRDLEQSHLAPYAYTKIESEGPAKRLHRAAFTGATAIHLSNKAAFIPLLRAWRDAGIDVIVFKGFYLAELVYAQPAQRHYNDIDVIMEPERWPEARRLARHLGWTILWDRRSSLYDTSHEEAVLERAGTVIEVHRFAIDSMSKFDAIQRRLTRAAWERSSEVCWEGTSFRTLAPSDSALLGLVLARTWSGGDDWRLKPADYLDLQTLSRRLGLSRTDLERRAAELRCARSLDLFLARCDPWQERLSLRRPTPLERQRWNLAIAPERGHLGVERTMARLARLPGTLFDIVRQMPHLIRTERRLRQAGASPPAEWPDRAVATTATLRSKERIVRGVKWGAHLLKAGRDPCLLRSYALARALHAEGLTARVFEGRSRDANGERRHAWVHVEGMSMRDLEDVQVCRTEGGIKEPSPLGRR